MCGIFLQTLMFCVFYKGNDRIWIRVLSDASFGSNMSVFVIGSMDGKREFALTWGVFQRENKWNISKSTFTWTVSVFSCRVSVLSSRYFSCWTLNLRIPAFVPRLTSVGRFYFWIWTYFIKVGDGLREIRLFLIDWRHTPGVRAVQLLRMSHVSGKTRDERGEGWKRRFSLLCHTKLLLLFTIIEFMEENKGNIWVRLMPHTFGSFCGHSVPPVAGISLRVSRLALKTHWMMRRKDGTNWHLCLCQSTLKQLRLK